MQPTPDGPPPAYDDVFKAPSYEEIARNNHGPPTPPPPVYNPLTGPPGAWTDYAGARTGGAGIFTIEDHVTRGSQRDNHVHPSPEEVVEVQPLPFQTHEFGDVDQKVRKKPYLPPENGFLDCIGFFANCLFFYVSKDCRHKAQLEYDAGRYGYGRLRAVLAFVFYVLMYLTPPIVALCIVYA